MKKILYLYTRFCFLFVLLIYSQQTINAQIVSGNAFLKGNYVEVGVGPCGSFGTTINSPVGYHSRVGSVVGNQPLGFVANITKGDWSSGTPNFVGDYFLPGSPEEGWGLTINGINYNNNQLCSEKGIPGSIVSYNISSSNVDATFQGSINGLNVSAKTYIPVNSLYFVTNVTITNTSATTVNNIYYMRNVDPDQGVFTPGGGSTFLTTNTVAYQNPNACNYALATATTVSGGYYLGLGSIDSRAKVTTGGFSNRSAYNIWNGISLNTSGTVTADQAISLSFNLGNLAPNQSTTFAYAYILSEGDLNIALAATNIGFNVKGVTYLNGSTNNICNNTATPISLINTGTYTSWIWSPSTGLNTSTGTSVIATVNTPTTYTATGSGSCGSTSVNITLNPVSGISVSDAGAITGSTSLNLGQANINYSIDNVVGATSYSWTLPPGSIVTSGLNSNSITFNASNTEWCGNVQVVPVNTCNEGKSSNLAVCIGDLVQTGFVVSPLCTGQALSLPYTAHGVLPADNMFTAQLSDSAGSFASPVVIGSLTTTTLNGNITTTIPANTIIGNHYRFRVISSVTSMKIQNNGIDISINSQPVLTCPSNQTIYTSLNNCSAIASYLTTATGLGTIVTFSPASGSSLPTGINVINVAATNNCGTASCSFNVTVIDTIPPTVITKPVTIILDANGNTNIVAADVNNNSTDNCGISSYSLNKTSFNYSNLGSNIVTLTVKDNNGNSANNIANVTVIANGLNAYGRLATDGNAQTNQYGAKALGFGKTQNGQIFGSSSLRAGGFLPLNFITYAATGSSPAIPPAGTQLSTGTVPNINYNWNTGVILNSGQSEHVQVHFTGIIVWPGIAGINKTITFYNQSDEGLKMFVNSNLVIDNYIDQFSQTTPNYNGSGSIALVAGATYPIDIWYYNNTGSSKLQVFWNIGDGIVIIPAIVY